MNYLNQRGKNNNYHQTDRMPGGDYYPEEMEGGDRGGRFRGRGAPLHYHHFPRNLTGTQRNSGVQTKRGPGEDPGTTEETVGPRWRRQRRRITNQNITNCWRIKSTGGWEYQETRIRSDSLAPAISCK